MFSKKERSYFRVACEVAKMSDHPQRVGCVITLGHRIISSSCNSQTKCHPIQAKLDMDKYNEECPGRIHAEVAALIPLIKNNVDISKATIYVVRLLKNGSMAMARPCSSCMRLIKALNIHNIAYSTDDSLIKEYLQI